MDRSSYLADQLRPNIERQDTRMRSDIPGGKRLAVYPAGPSWSMVLHTDSYSTISWSVLSKCVKRFT